MNPLQARIHSWRKHARDLVTRVKEIRPWTAPDGYPIPPIRLRDKVRRGQISREGFIREGRQVFDTIIGVLERQGVNLDSGLRVYEFGCGCGRVARHFLQRKVSITGSDVDAELVAWCRGHLLPGEFLVNEFDPPLALPDDTFDVAYAISVFTHIPLDRQMPWLSELHRVLKPGGLALISILQSEQSEPGREAYAMSRPDPGIRRDWLGQDTAPAEYLDVFHSSEFIEREWTRFFRCR